MPDFQIQQQAQDRPLIVIRDRFCDPFAAFYKRPLNPAVKAGLGGGLKEMSGAVFIRRDAFPDCFQQLFRRDKQAVGILQECGCDPELTRRVCFLVAHHHTYTNIESGDYQILVEADFLVNLYEHSSKYGSAETAKVKIFKTATGTRLLEQMFLTKPC